MTTIVVGGGILGACTLYELSRAVEYASVDEIWEPAILVGGPGGPVADALGPEEIAQGRAIFEEALGRPAGRFRLSGRAAAVRGMRG